MYVCSSIISIRSNSSSSSSSGINIIIYFTLIIIIIIIFFITITVEQASAIISRVQLFREYANWYRTHELITCDQLGA